MTQIEIFSKIWPKSKFFEISKKNRILTKVVTKIENFRKLWPQSNLKKKFNQKRNISKFSKILTKIGTFIRKFDQNLNFTKFSKKKSIFFENFTKIESLEIFEKSKFLVNFDHF